MIIVLPLFLGIDGLIFSGPVADFLAAVTCIILIIKEFKEMAILELEENNKSIDL